MGSPVAFFEQKMPAQNLEEQLLAAETEAFLQQQEAELQARTQALYADLDSLAAIVPEAAPLPTVERPLTEVDNLNRHRLPDGSHSQWALDELEKNLVPYVKEGGMPSAVSRTYQEYVENHEDVDGRRNTFMWLGRTALQVARSGRAYYKHEAALARGDVEVEEAIESDHLRPGFATGMVSPKMSTTDAPHDVAKAENLADDDALRISWLDVDSNGKILGKYIESVLVHDVPLESWVTMLADKNNIFGKPIDVPNPNSALSVMRQFREMELPLGKLSEGVVSLVSAVLPYIADAKAVESVQTQLADFRKDQATKHERAMHIARRWRDFEAELSDSLFYKYATPVIKAFVDQLKTKWSEDDATLIVQNQMPDGRLAMPRELALRIEEAKRKLLWDEASVVADERHVLEQLDQATAEQIKYNALQVQWLYACNRQLEAQQLEVTNNQLIADQNLKNGGGCAGESEMRFRNSQEALAGQPNTNSGDEDEASIPSNICCIKCKRYSPKEQVIHKGKTKDSGYWHCPKCDYGVDVCTGEQVDRHGNKLSA